MADRPDQGMTGPSARTEGVSAGHVFRSLAPHLWPKGQPGLRLRVVLALTCLAVAKVATIGVPILLKDAVDLLTGPSQMRVALPVGLLVAYGAARFSATAFGEVRDALFVRVGQHAIHRVALQIFRHLHALSLRFHLERRTGGLARAIERGSRGIDSLLSVMLFNILPTLLEIGLVVGVLWGLLDARFALVTLAAVVSYIGFTLVVTEWRNRFRRQMNETDQEVSGRAIDSLLNYETVKYFGNEEHEAQRYDRSLSSYERAAVRSESSLGALNVGQAAIVGVALTGVLLMAAQGVSSGRLTIGEFVMVNTYLLQLFTPLNFLGWVYRSAKQSLIDMEAMFGLLEVPPEVVDPPGATELRVTGGTVDLEHVDFGYDARRPILRDVTFTVPAGKKVAVVGASGAGKSTLARLLFRFYDVDRGAVRIDGQDIRTVTQASLRRALGVVPQDTVLFNDTVYENIAYGRPSATPAEVERAARLAHIHDFILSTPDGYRTVVGERGLKLSGGEKQRVAIARTILKAPPILVFDEATSALDSATEREIQAALREVAAEHTTLVIAHRLSTIVDADEILVLDGGRIVERGRHAALLAEGGLYADLWRKQQAEREEEPEERSEASAFAPAPAPPSLRSAGRSG